MLECVTVQPTLSAAAWPRSSAASTCCRPCADFSAASDSWAAASWCSSSGRRTVCVCNRSFVCHDLLRITHASYNRVQGGHTRHENRLLAQPLLCIDAT